MVRAKFKCTHSHNGDIRLSAVTSGSEENKQFFKYTPSGELSISTVNEDAAKQFEVGKEYYLDLSPAS